MAKYRFGDKLKLKRGVQNNWQYTADYFATYTIHPSEHPDMGMYGLSTTGCVEDAFWFIGEDFLDTYFRILKITSWKNRIYGDYTYG